MSKKEKIINNAKKIILNGYDDPEIVERCVASLSLALTISDINDDDFGWSLIGLNKILSKIRDGKWDKKSFKKIVNESHEKVKIMYICIKISQNINFVNSDSAILNSWSIVHLIDTIIKQNLNIEDGE